MPQKKDHGPTPLIVSKLLLSMSVFLAVFSLRPWAAAQNAPNVVLLNDQHLGGPVQDQTMVQPQSPGQAAEDIPKLLAKAPKLKETGPDMSKPPTSIQSLEDLEGCWANERFGIQDTELIQFLYCCFDKAGSGQCYTAIYSIFSDFFHDCRFKASATMNENDLVITETEVCEDWTPLVYDCELMAPGRLNCLYSYEQETFLINFVFAGPPVPDQH